MNLRSRWAATPCLFAVGLGLASPAPAWGPLGHRIVAEIAARHLAPEVAAAARRLLGGESLAQASLWADAARSRDAWRHTAPWHFFDLPDGTDPARAAHPAQGDVLMAILGSEENLRGGVPGSAERARALRFLIHFVGDIHQPLHVGRPGDRGGNDLRVSFLGEVTNLHRLLDSRLLATQGLDAVRYARLVDRLAPARTERWAQDPPVVWAAESMALRREVYEIGDGEVGRIYLRRVRPLLERRLLMAGVRLAARLEALLRPSGKGRDG